MAVPFKIYSIKILSLFLSCTPNPFRKERTCSTWEQLLSLSVRPLFRRGQKTILTELHPLSAPKVFSLLLIYWSIVCEVCGFICNLFITKTRLFKYTENFITKKWKFSDKNSDIFLISAQNIDCEYSLEPPRRGGSNEYPQSMFWAEIRKIIYTPANPSFTI